MEDRILLTDSLQDIVIKIAEGNPGAIMVCAHSIRVSEVVDPQSAFAHYTGLIGFDSLGIYGSKIWMLYKDVCSKNIIHTLGMLRCVQMGILSEDKLHDAIEHFDKGLDIASLMTQLREKLPSFYASDDAETLKGVIYG